MTYRTFNFTCGIVICVAFALLGDANHKNPNQGWILGVLILQSVMMIGVGIGLVHSKLFEESGIVYALGVALVAVAVILAPAFFFPGWLGVAFSAMLLIFWERLRTAK